MIYTELFAAVQAYVENTFPTTTVTNTSGVEVQCSSTTQINLFITQAEQRIFNSVQFPVAQGTDVQVLALGGTMAACPTGFLSPLHVAAIDNLGVYTFLQQKDVSFLRAAFPDPGAQGVPRYYALYQPASAGSSVQRLQLAPAANATYSIEMQYERYPTSITVSADGRSWLGDTFDTVLLYGALLEACTFMKAETDIVAQYTKQYADALALAKRRGDGLQKQDAYRSGHVRTAVS